jgi:hypothetical protein
MRKLLFIGQGDSPHSINTIENIIKYSTEKFDMHFLGSSPLGIHQKIQDLCTIHYDISSIAPKTISDVNKYWEEMMIKGDSIFSRSSEHMANVLEQHSFDIIHFFAIQDGAYIYLEALKKLTKTIKKPYLVLSLWGNCIYYFSRMDSHRSKIEEFLKKVNKIQSENYRDLPLALNLGFKGDLCEVFQPTFSYQSRKEQVEEIPGLAKIKPNERNVIAVRGTYPVRGRGFLIIEALKKINRHILKNYKIVVFGASAMDEAAMQMGSEGLNYQIYPTLSWVDTQRLLSYSKFVIHMNTTDGTPQMFYEAAMLGVYPIFSSDTGLEPLISRLGNASSIKLADPNNVIEIMDSIEESIMLSDETYLWAASENQKKIAAQQAESRLIRLINNLYDVD